MATDGRLRILVCGATGLIGRALCARLEASGHEVFRGMRTPIFANDIAIDYTSDFSVEDWLPRVKGMDVVVNAVGIIVETGANRFDAIHHRAPAALFRASAEAGVTRIVQVSALGAIDGDTPYFQSKRAADDVLRQLPVSSRILYPSLVYAEDGDSARMFRTLASLPLIPVPALGDAKFQPVHVDDVVDAAMLAIASSTASASSIDVVGLHPVSYRAMLDAYRAGMQFPPARWITIPRPVMTIAARVAGFVPGSKLTTDNWRMLQYGCHADAAPMTQTLGRPPLAIDQFISRNDAPALRQHAMAAWRLPMLRAVMAMIWLATAFVTLFAYPIADSLAMLHAVGLDGTLATVALYGAVGVDAAMGMACLFYRGRGLWALQAAIVLGYSLVIAIAMPEFLWHPFGPVLKNLPILAILLILYTEQPSWNT
ncbi:SDR family oxidoreductase [Cupriavidus sp. SW-Y-13]|uniref:SDR family oxidoreductase n=1 Tax=Cupriavidus sp. SW-Y-13 TaxID=2653854 RepID=UPI00136672D1|nr:SDR family oxidoreductase [Cupriavidus sp. SW-Y-13]MWL89381.1 NAD(P)H-binding protein [Cupriavidus sp. SW-Y-13]